MAYRDDRQALALQLEALERENEQLKLALDAAEERYRALTRASHEGRRAIAVRCCALCGGTLLPVAVFAGHDSSAPLPLSMSTLRFGSPKGGFTHSAAIHCLACSSCGFIHHFVDMPRIETAEAGPPLPQVQVQARADDGEG